MILRAGIDQGRLRERDECSGGRIEEQKGDEQDGEGVGSRRQQEGGREHEPATYDDRSAPAPVAEDPEHRLDHATDEPGERQEQPNLRVVEVEVGAEQRPRRFARAKRHFVDELDRQQDDHHREHPWRSATGSRCEHHNTPRESRSATTSERRGCGGPRAGLAS